MLQVDVQQVFISTAAVFGIGLLWINFNEKVFQTVRYLIAAPFKSSEPERAACDEDKWPKDIEEGIEDEVINRMAPH